MLGIGKWHHSWVQRIVKKCSLSHCNVTYEDLFIYIIIAYSDFRNEVGLLRFWCISVSGQLGYMELIISALAAEQFIYVGDRPADIRIRSALH